MKTWRLRLVCGACLVSLFLCMEITTDAGAFEKCHVCGMDVGKYQHTRMVVETTDGKNFATCGAQCCVRLHVLLGPQWKSAVALDLLSNRPVNAKEAFYVFKSSVITDMAPGLISFKLKANAEKFAAGFGGEVLTYDEAVAVWKKRTE